MDWSDSIAAGLPQPHDDEPPSLRDDIADELADHLHASLARELRRTADEGAAREAVLERFGDPRQIARKLWLDAMKEKLMAQRLTLAAVAALVAICGAMSFANWQMVRQGRELNLALLEELRAQRASPAAVPLSNDWTKISVRCVKGRPGGEPAAAYDVWLEGKLLNESDTLRLHQKTSPDGTVSFGPVRPGQYEISLLSPWLETAKRQFVALGAAEHVEEVICPVVAPSEKRVPVAAGVDWPADLRDKPLFVECQFVLNPFGLDVTRGILYEYTREWSLRDDEFFLYGRSQGGGWLAPLDETQADDRAYEMVTVEGVPDPSARWDPNDPSSARAPGKSLSWPIGDKPVTAQVRSGDYFLGGLTIRAPKATDTAASLGTIAREWLATLPGDETSTFEAKQKGENRWTIKLSDSVLRDIREHLAKAKPVAQAAPAPLDSAAPERESDEQEVPVEVRVDRPAGFSRANPQESRAGLTGR